MNREFLAVIIVLADTDEEGGSRTTSIVFVSGVQDERATWNPIDDGTLYQLRYSHVAAIGQAVRALDSARCSHAMPVVTVILYSFFISFHVQHAIFNPFFFSLIFST